MVRSLPSFSRFLTIAGSSNGHQINFERFSSVVGVSAKILRSYMQVLVDTLVADMLLPLQHSQKRKAVSSPKFYFFDVGVANALRGIARVPRGSEIFGDNLEHLVFLELKALQSYSMARFDLTYWRTTSHHEVDFIVSTGKNIVAIEVKGTAHPDAAAHLWFVLRVQCSPVLFLHFKSMLSNNFGTRNNFLERIRNAKRHSESRMSLIGIHSHSQQHMARASVK